MWTCTYRRKPPALQPLTGTGAPKWAQACPEAARLIADLLQPQATLRPTVDEALECAWLQPADAKQRPEAKSRPGSAASFSNSRPGSAVGSRSGSFKVDQTLESAGDSRPESAAGSRRGSGSGSRPGSALSVSHSHLEPQVLAMPGLGPPSPTQGMTSTDRTYAAVASSSQIVQESPGDYGFANTSRKADGRMLRMSLDYETRSNGIRNLASDAFWTADMPQAIKHNEQEEASPRAEQHPMAQGLPVSPPAKSQRAPKPKGPGMSLDSMLGTPLGGAPMGGATSKQIASKGHKSTIIANSATSSQRTAAHADKTKAGGDEGMPSEGKRRPSNRVKREQELAEENARVLADERLNSQLGNYKRPSHPVWKQIL